MEDDLSFSVQGSAYPLSAPQKGYAHAMDGAPAGTFFQPKKKMSEPVFEVILNSENQVTVTEVAFTIIGATEVVVTLSEMQGSGAATNVRCLLVTSQITVPDMLPYLDS